MRQKQRTILQPDRESEGNGVGHNAKHKQKATLECHLLNLTIFVVDFIRSELVWHFWLNSVLVFLLSLCNRVYCIHVPVLFLFDWVGVLWPQLSKVLKVACWAGSVPFPTVSLQRQVVCLPLRPVFMFLSQGRDCK